MAEQSLAESPSEKVVFPSFSSFEVSNYEVVRPTGEQVPEPSTVVCGLEGSSFVMVWCLTTDFHSRQRGPHWYQWRRSRTGAEGI